jgi:hypothetical protein
MKEENYKEYKDFNIKCIKTMLENLQKVDYEKLEITELISLEHNLYYNLYLDFEENKTVEKIDFDNLGVE